MAHCRYPLLSSHPSHYHIDDLGGIFGWDFEILLVSFPQNEIQKHEKRLEKQTVKWCRGAREKWDEMKGNGVFIWGERIGNTGRQRDRMCSLGTLVLVKVLAQLVEILMFLLLDDDLLLSFWFGDRPLSPEWLFFFRLSLRLNLYNVSDMRHLYIQKGVFWFSFFLAGEDSRPTDHSRTGRAALLTFIFWVKEEKERERMRKFRFEKCSNF